MKKFFKDKSYKKIFLFITVIVLLLVFSNVYVNAADSTNSSSALASSLKTETESTSGVEKYIILAFGWLCGLIVSAIGSLNTFLIQKLVDVSTFNHFSDIPAVVQGWSLVRDICNMFFVLVFLVIAFATILRIESYNAKRALPKLLIMAVLINFSRMIFSLLIDFSQIVMMTFTAQIKGGYIVDAFNMQKLGSLKRDLENGVSEWGVVTALVLSVIATFITLVVIIILLAAFLMRIIMLWIYIILSPLVFLGFAFPAISGYVSRIWQDFIKQLILGPILGFFLWLGLGIVNNQIENSSDVLCAGKSGFFCTGDFQKFIIFIGVLMGGLMVAQNMSSGLGNLSGRLMGTGKTAALGAIGANWAARRWRAFQSQRQAAKEQKAAEFGARAFNLYRAGTTIPKATLRGIRETGARPIYWAKTMANQTLNKTPLKNIRDSVKRNLQIRKDAFNAFKEMQATGKDEIKKDGLVYRSNNKGGVDVFAEKQGKKQKIKSFNKSSLDFTKGFVAEITPAMNAISEAIKNKVEKIKVNIGNLDEIDLKNIIQSRTANKEEKMAAASLLASQRKIKDRETFNQIKDILSNNHYLKDEFNKIADKYYAVWNNNKEELKAKATSKKVELENLDLSQFEDGIREILETAGDEFPKIMDKVASRGSETSKRLANAIRNAMNDPKLTLDQRKKLRKTYVDRTGRLNEAFGSDNMAKAEYIKNAKVDHLDKLLDHKENEDLLKQHITKVQVERFKRADKSAQKAAKLEEMLKEREENLKHKKDQEGLS